MFLSKCSGIYYLFFSDDLGKRRKVSTRVRHKAEAVKFLREFKQAEYERKQRLTRVSLSTFSAEFLKYSKQIHAPKTQESHGTALSELQKAIGDMPLHKIGVKDVELFLASKVDAASLWTARKYYIALASSFETARRWGHLLENPFRSIPKPRPPELQPEFFSRKDFETLLEGIGDFDLRELVFFAVSTGFRLGEILALRWEDVDIEAGLVHVKNSATFTTKTKRNRSVPMTEGLKGMLVARKQREVSETRHVFHRHGEKWTARIVSHAFKDCVRAVGLSDRLHFHSLRHYAELGISGIPLRRGLPGRGSHCGTYSS
jgi:integrase